MTVNENLGWRISLMRNAGCLKTFAKDSKYGRKTKSAWETRRHG